MKIHRLHHLHLNLFCAFYGEPRRTLPFPECVCVCHLRPLNAHFHEIMAANPPFAKPHFRGCRFGQTQFKSAHRKRGQRKVAMSKTGRNSSNMFPEIFGDFLRTSAQGDASKKTKIVQPVSCGTNFSAPFGRLRNSEEVLFSCRKNQKSQAPIKLAQPISGPTIADRRITDIGFFLFFEKLAALR